MGAITNLTGLAAKLVRRIDDGAVRRRAADTHRAMVDMARGTLGGYFGVARDMVRAFAAEGMTHPDECLLLMALAAEVRRGVIVEIGSFRGRSTLALAAGSHRGHGVPVYAVEPHADFDGVLGGRFGPPDRIAFEANLARSPHAGLVHLVSATSRDAARDWDREIGLLWIDGDHRYDAVREDVDLWSPFLNAGARIAFDDSTVPGLGPHTVVAELLAGGGYQRLRVVGKVTVLGRTAPAGR